MIDIFLFIMIAFLGINFFEYYLSHKRQKELIGLDAKKQKEEINKTIKDLDEKIINKKEAYEKKKQTAYDIINKRNNSTDKP